MEKVWKYIKIGVSYAVASPIYFYEYVKNYPGQVVILWPLSLGLAIWLL